MVEHRDYRALEWVGDEIEEALTQARAALQAWLANRDDVTRLRFCLSHVHQVAGSLRMVEFSAPALLAEALERCAQGLLDDSVPLPLRSDAAQALSAALDGLSSYIADLRLERREQPARLMPLINDLRAVIQRPLVSETVLFQPLLPATAGVAQSLLSAPELLEVAGKLRQMYQIALTQLLRGEDQRKNLNYLAKVAARLVKLTAGSPQEPLWKALIAICEGLLNRSISMGPALNVLLRQIDGQLKSITERGEAALNAPPAAFLVQNLLFYIAVSGADSRFIAEIRQQHQLDQAMATGISGANVRRQLALQLRMLADRPEAPASDWLRVADALALLNQARMLAEFRDLALRQRRGQTASIEVLRQLAGALDETPASVSAPVLFNDSEEAQQQLDSAFEAVIRESRNILEQAKEAIVEFVAGQWRHESLEEVPHLLAHVRGSLVIAGMTRAAAVLSACEHYVADQLLGQRQVPDWQLLDTLADAITSIDYYLERSEERNSEPVDAVLAMAEQSVARLGGPAAADPGAARPHVSEPLEAGSRPDPQAVGESLPPGPQPAEQPPIEFGSLAEAEPEPAFQLPVADSMSAPGVSDTAVFTPEPQSEPPAADSDAEDFDPEIAEIFVEEAAEVLETLDALLPDWRVAPAATAVLNDVRRGFHTLKGSGRMVGATAIGEFSWSMESLLNRLIDGSVDADEMLVATITEAHAELPAMVDAFKRRVDFATDNPVAAERVGRLAARAEALAKGQPWAEPEPLPVEVELDELPSPAVAGDAAAADADRTATDAAPEPYPGSPVRPMPAADATAASDADTDGQAGDAGPAIAPAPEPVLAEPAETHAVQFEGRDEVDPVLRSIFATEALNHLEVLDQFLSDAACVDQPAYSDDLQRALHTLKGSAHMAGVVPVATIVTPIEQLVKALRAAQSPLDATALGLMTEASMLIRQGLDQLENAPSLPVPGSDDFVARVDAFVQSRIAALEAKQDGAVAEGVTPEVFRRFLDDAMELVSAVGEDIQQWSEQKLDDQRQHTLAATLSQVADYASDMNQPAVEELAQALQALLRQGAEWSRPAPAFFSLGRAAIDCLIDMFDRLAAQQHPDVDEALLNALREFEFDPPAAATDGPRSGSASDGPAIGTADVGSVDEGAVAAGADGMDAVTIDAVIGDDTPPAGPEANGGTAIDGEPPANDAAVGAVQHGGDDSDAEMDAEILEIFLEEAGDLLEAIDEAVLGWQSAPENVVFLDDLQRLLHTLKGGARLTGLTALGNLSHNFETLLIHVQSRGEQPDAEVMAAVVQYQDQLVAGIEAIRSGDPAAIGVEPIEPAEEAGRLEESEPSAQSADPGYALETLQEQQFETGRYGGPASRHAHYESSDHVGTDHASADQHRAPAPEKSSRIAMENSAVVVPFQRNGERNSGEAATDEYRELVPFVAPSPDTPDPADRAQLSQVQTGAANLRRGPQEMVKVPAPLLENLVNLAGETSIARARSEEQVSELVFALDEMQITVDRLQEQVRRLDRETEAQILFRQEQVESEGMEGFDPLEFDRYSLLQQLSRSLLESASDLTDIKSTLGDKSRDMEQLLVQQSRINTELQEGLMRSRMVPFSRMVPRLRRIVRQVAGELGKEVQFLVDNAEGELDRTVLEKIVAPLEHMLRNAVDHGIEPGEQRRRSGKPPLGTITLGLTREGGEVVMRLQDDGGGIDLEAVRNKAIERGMMDADAQLSDYEVLQFILQAGFSTAKRVTQISGRGVGMDVVHSEIKQLGGNVEIDSRLGEGTRFTIRLPFTVSVNRALMVHAAGDTYAVPLNTIEGIVRVSPFELEAYYQPDAPPFEYAGQEYLMRYLGALLRTSDRPNLEGQSMPLPVILVRGSDHVVAVQVDGLLGSREIVVKTLGPQFAQVQGLSGATVLGDGSVVVILDLLAMIRADASHLHRDFSLGHDERGLLIEQRPLSVMVVDDSVTVRKVTSRFLERQGMEVMLAKDGMDAITQLQEVERPPDVMLLDIEMPRMDGFEVASRVRHTSRLKAMPIVMITSRTGDKHRERALSLGVNRYLGKPYQESVLLASIFELTGRTPEPLVE